MIYSFTYFYLFFFFFFFQAEDGIRDTSVTGVQTCALPIFNPVDLQVDRIDLNRSGIGNFSHNIDAGEDRKSVVGKSVDLGGRRIIKKKKKKKKKTCRTRRKNNKTEQE